MSEFRSVCVYCGSSSTVADVYKDAAHTVGTLLARHGIELVYGGGRVGLMGIAADAALAAGGRVVGIIPDHIQALEVEHTGLDELIVVPDMHTRKQLMERRSDAFVVLPGGLGTLDEMFEILTWRQLRLHGKPLAIIDVDGYWRPLVGLIDHMIAEGFVRPGNRNFFTVVDRPEAVLEALAGIVAPAA